MNKPEARHAIDLRMIGAPAKNPPAKGLQDGVETTYTDTDCSVLKIIIDGIRCGEKQWRELDVEKSVSELPEEKIAEKTCQSTRTVIRVIKKLEYNGLLRVNKHAGKGRRNTYVPCVQQIAAWPTRHQRKIEARQRRRAQQHEWYLKKEAKEVVSRFSRKQDVVNVQPGVEVPVEVQQ